VALMRVLAAPQEFKGSLTAHDAARAIAAGVHEADPTAEVDLAPLADGGPGFVEALVLAAGGERRMVQVRDPLGRPVTAVLGLLDGGRAAVIEMAEAAGLKRLAPSELDPRRASTHGVGDLIRAALDTGAARLLVGVGGSATNDGGAGMAEALGVRLLDRRGRPLPPGGAALTDLYHIDAAGLDPRLRQVEVVVATDVQNPLAGPEGASAIFGPQKGADEATVAELDRALARLAAVVARDLAVDAAETPGAGAAGGLGFGLIAFAGASPRPGFPIVAEAVGLEQRAAAADLILTGEGRLDGQTGYGKTVAGVAAVGRRAARPVVALCGGLLDGWQRLHADGLTAAFSIAPGPLTLVEAEARAAALLRDAAVQVVRLFRAGR
jgi:glycerate 2-kinase